MAEHKDSFKYFCPKCGKETEWTTSHQMTFCEFTQQDTFEHIFHCTGGCGTNLSQSYWNTWHRQMKRKMGIIKEEWS